MLVNKDILTVKDLNKYLPALKTEIDIHFKEKLKEGLFKVDALSLIHISEPTRRRGL